MPGKGFQLLGMISNAKPSAIFRVRNAGYSSQNISEMEAMIPLTTSGEAVVGISVQPLDAVYAQAATLSSAATSESALAPPTRFDDPAVLAQGIAQNLINFLSSFESVGNGVLVRLMDLERWYEKLAKRLKGEGVSLFGRTE